MVSGDGVLSVGGFLKRAFRRPSAASPSNRAPWSDIVFWADKYVLA